MKSKMYAAMVSLKAESDAMMEIRMLATAVLSTARLKMDQLAL